MGTCDVIIIGGGPAGSTAAALLAHAGRHVVLLEKESFPRFHIGESLLPSDVPVLEALGYRPDRTSFVPKAGAEFIDERTGSFAEYLFADGLPGTPGYAWQVERSRFDADLLDLARSRGAEVKTGERVQHVDIDDAGVQVRSEHGMHRARYVIDASGQDAFFARRARTVQPLKGFGLAAVFRHYEGLSPHVVAELEPKGNIKVLIHAHGWGWVIPLRGDKLSFGVVSREQGIGPALLERVFAASPLVARLTEGARPTEPRVVSNFSYRNQVSRGPRWCCVGDAACFLDPVFSSGVSLAMISAQHAANALIGALASEHEAEPDLMQAPQDRMSLAYEAFAALIHAFYHTRIVEHLFFCDDPDLQMRAGLITMLAGDVWRDDNRFQNALMSGRRGRAPEEGLAPSRRS